MGWVFGIHPSLYPFRLPLFFASVPRVVQGGRWSFNKEIFYFYLSLINSFASPRNRLLFDSKVLVIGSPSGDGKSHIGPILREGGFNCTLGYDHRSTHLITRVPYLENVYS